MKLKFMLDVVIILVCLFHIKVSWVTNEYAFQGYVLALLGWLIVAVHDWRGKV